MVKVLSSDLPRYVILNFEKGDKIESQNFAKLFKTQNFKEGVAAFLEKRKANYETLSTNSQIREKNK